MFFSISKNGPWLTAQSMTSHTFASWAAGQNTFRVRAVNSAGAGSPLVAATRGVNQVTINRKRLGLSLRPNLLNYLLFGNL